MSVAVGFIHPATAIAPQFRRCLTHVYLRDAGSTRRIVDEFDQESSANISSARNNIVRAFLAHPAKPHWLWMIDSDMTFGDDILERLLESADEQERPIVGGLCFGVRPVKLGGREQFNAVLAAPLELFPTIYTTDESGRMFQWHGYPLDTVFQVHSTGAACMLVHRRVFEHPGWHTSAHPFPWFREAVSAGEAVSEDHFFCLKAGSLGFPIHVNSAAKTGHVKVFVADEDAYVAQRLAALSAQPEPATEPVAVIIPVLSRPDNIAPLVSSLHETAGDLATPYFVVDHDDTAELTAVMAAGARVITYKGAKPGTFAEKVNLGYRNTIEPWILLCGDDVRFHPGWLDEAETAAARSGAQVVGTNDLWVSARNPNHSPHPMIRRGYVDDVGASWDGPGVVAHEGYAHWFVDNEIAVAAQFRGTWTKANRSIVEHLHYLSGKAPKDAVYSAGERNAKKDEAVWKARFAAQCQAAGAAP